jgi:hypothetical protein
MKDGGTPLFLQPGTDKPYPAKTGGIAAPLLT